MKKINIYNSIIKLHIISTKMENLQSEIEKRVVIEIKNNVFSNKTLKMYKTLRKLGEKKELVSNMILFFFLEDKNSIVRITE